MEPTEWDRSNAPEWDGCYAHREDGWYAVWLSYGDTEDDMSIEACQFLDSKPVKWTVAILLAHAGPFPDEAAAEAWADAHDPYWSD